MLKNADDGISGIKNRLQMSDSVLSTTFSCRASENVHGTYQYFLFSGRFGNYGLFPIEISRSIWNLIDLFVFRTNIAHVNKNPFNIFFSVELMNLFSSW